MKINMAHPAHSQPSDVAVCFTTSGASLFAASFDHSGTIETEEFRLGESIYPRLKSWRDRLGQSTNLQTAFRFVPFLFTEQTRIAPLPDDVLTLADPDLTRFLIDAAASGTAGADGAPLFESSLQKSAYDFARLPNGQISLTEIPRERLHDALKQLLGAEPIDSRELASLTMDLPDEIQPVLLHAVETRLRAIFRFLASRDAEYFERLGENENIAVFAFTPEGCGFALWNPGNAFYAEYGEWFNHNFDESEIPEPADRGDYIGQLYQESVYNFLHEQFYKRVVPEDENLPSLNIKQIYWTATDGLNEPLAELLREFAEQTAFACRPAGDEPMEEMIVRGLLLAFDETSEAMVPSINLANDLTTQNESIIGEQLNLQAAALRAKRRAAFVCLLLPVMIALGLVAGMWLNNWRAAASLAWREAAATTEIKRLQPILNDRAAYEKTLSWYSDILGQIISLRQKQASSLSFAARLDPLYPATGAFYVSDMKLAPGGAFELKGFTRDETEVTRFVQAMEFAQSEQSARYFTNLQLEFKQGSKIAGAAAPLPGTSGAGITGTLAPGVSGFVLKGNFAPAGALRTTAPAPPGAGVNPPPVNTNAGTGAKTQ